MKIHMKMYGHPNITANHKTTLEFTKERNVNKEGDCIVGVRSDLGFCDLSEGEKDELRRSAIRITIMCDGIFWSVIGRGTNALKMKNEKEMVIRKSNFQCDRTLMIDSDKAACDMPRELVKCLRNPEKEIRVTIQTIGLPDNILPHRNNRI